ncbi:hypothetical protein [Desulforhopalus sp. IMCC35007]|uniref:hypothetical protein n=1 Tax=Desulforhopalus sp. IMCC35007 TaxID=2569543 RepID=UPI0010ADE487|nr:hypothetical protein [Desulforhopalus sp. IMCC35007]TKB12257.1 hypothetical protein FCL48_00985 [Desulforhopalus sp. IMCC35007]
MLKRKNSRIVFTLTLVLAFAAPLLSNGQDTGKDWYCSDPAAHAQYEKHLKTHLDKTAEAISESLEKIYSNPNLSKEEKKAQAIDMLDKYLAKKQIGMGD